MVVASTSNETGLYSIDIVNFENNKKDSLDFGDANYNLELIFTNYHDKRLRYSYSSPITPVKIIEYDFKSNEHVVLKDNALKLNFNSDEYITERIYADSRDGKKIPISLLYKKSLKDRSDNPLYLYGYGSYGISIPNTFNKSIFSLINRGFVFAIAHIRGGNELGYDWYQDGKFLKKKNTFYDFIDSAKYLIEQKYTKAGDINIAGGSAGGMLVGFCINDSPELFNTAVAHVPFVDVLNTMLDDTLPLTPSEFKEWGNPKEDDYFNYIKTYSPYDNVKRQNYPNLFVTAGLYDPRVTYWEPAKWVAKLREYGIGNNTIILKTNMGGGHSGKSGRYEYIYDIAEEYAFVIQNNQKHLASNKENE